MDCNSIIYDVFRNIETHNPDLLNNVDELETEIINKVISSIHSYVYYIKPNELLYIAFDGVAPFAKMEQQRVRRYKNSSSSSIGWSTSNITPGTLFMSRLSKRVRGAFSGLEEHYNVKQIIVSASDEPGEGEHKMFQYIRDHCCSRSKKQCAVYGLDSDLIMLALFHCKHFGQLYIFRETPAFGKQLFPDTVELKDNECHFLDIPLLANCIVQELKCKSFDSHRIYDYVFLCFFLGNDFLPHFPSLNIRTSGIDTLIQTYTKLFGNHSDRFFVSHSLEIQWRYVHSFIYELAKYESERFIGEVSMRGKWGKRKWAMDTDEDRDFLTQSVPVIFRSEELYIAPSNKFWQNRYYKCLFGPDIQRKSVCINYIEGLEWVFRYYTQNCPHWKWKYNYSYPPLLKDLVTHVPKTSTSFIRSDCALNIPFHGHIQLCYVLPKHQHSLLPFKYQNLFTTKYNDCFADSFEYHWAFCRYLWEAHPILPTISMDTLNAWTKIATV
jgi:5'-3' exonuclease